MEADLINYLLHIAPSLAVLIVLFWRMEKRQDETQEYIQQLLNDCWERVLGPQGPQEPR